MELRSRRLAGIAGAALILGSLAAAAGPAALAQDDPALCALPEGQNGQYKVGIATREMVNDVNRDIVNGATAAIEAAGGTVHRHRRGRRRAQAQREHREPHQLRRRRAVRRPGRRTAGLAADAATAADKGIKVSTALFGATPDGALTDVGWDDPLASSMMTRALLSSHRLQGRRLRLLGARRAHPRDPQASPGGHRHRLSAGHAPRGAHGARCRQEPVADDRPADGESGPGSIAGVWGAYDLLVSGANEAITPGRSQRDQGRLDRR